MVTSADPGIHRSRAEALSPDRVTRGGITQSPWRSRCGAVSEAKAITSVMRSPLRHRSAQDGGDLLQRAAGLIERMDNSLEIRQGLVGVDATNDEPLSDRETGTRDLVEKALIDNSATVDENMASRERSLETLPAVGARK